MCSTASLSNVVGREGRCVPEPGGALLYSTRYLCAPFYGFPGSFWHNLGKPVSFCIWTVEEARTTAMPTHNAQEGDQHVLEDGRIPRRHRAQGENLETLRVLCVSVVKIHSGGAVETDLSRPSRNLCFQKKKSRPETRLCFWKKSADQDPSLFPKKKS